MRKRFFVEVLKEICVEEGLKIEVFSHDWLCKITDPRTSKFVWTYGYNFTLNTSVSHMIANDKVATSAVLTRNNISNVKHLQLFNSEVRKDMLIENSLEIDLDLTLLEFEYPVVVKPNMGTLGKNVFLCHSREEVLKAISVIDVKDSVAISKYYESDFEYRFYILENEILFMYKKSKTKDSWKHNLNQGATPQREVASVEMRDLALSAFKVLGLRCAAVDILETKEGYKVLEVNSGISMDKFVSFSQDNYLLGKDAHRKMLFAAMEMK